ncbi:hypothetical protein HXX76_008195 [Chlamydomonas incerta]|uniref:RING-type domain-containing protein n=1 Tax=Chlamydomonas incerta TaxID=51695 RepID=A0A835SV88_CHLIN|nr:hypothetical protein HXX76_008195 [Chlamydomonas incerta]|eukprot:KAG2433839.1 hypothetical protein HXX76_008195 [Chlamydomonas incerta]
MSTDKTAENSEIPRPESGSPAPDNKRRRKGQTPKPVAGPDDGGGGDGHGGAGGAEVIPQARATLDPDDFQDRPAAPLARELSCALCGELLKEAMTALECGHTYCYDCIEARVDIGGNHNVCPVPGCGAVLGPSPFDHHRLVYDSLLDGLVAKIFPRPALDAALSKRRMEREAAVREARAAVNGCGGLGSLKSPTGGGVARPTHSASPFSAGAGSGHDKSAAEGTGASGRVSGRCGGRQQVAVDMEEDESTTGHDEADASGGRRLRSPASAARGCRGSGSSRQRGAGR